MKSFFVAMKLCFGDVGFDLGDVGFDFGCTIDFGDVFVGEFCFRTLDIGVRILGSDICGEASSELAHRLVKCDCVMVVVVVV